MYAIRSYYEFYEAVGDPAHDVKGIRIRFQQVVVDPVGFGVARGAPVDISQCHEAARRVRVIVQNGLR